MMLTFNAEFGYTEMFVLCTGKQMHDEMKMFGEDYINLSITFLQTFGYLDFVVRAVSC